MSASWYWYDDNKLDFFFVIKFIFPIKLRLKITFPFTQFLSNLQRSTIPHAYLVVRENKELIDTTGRHGSWMNCLSTDQSYSNSRIKHCTTENLCVFFPSIYLHIIYPIEQNQYQHLLLLVADR